MTGGGTRQGDFMRLPRASGYNAVLVQQGHVQLDADWNEQALLDAERLRETLRDLIGHHGGPAARAGFLIEPITALRFANGSDSLAMPVDDWGDALLVQLEVEAQTEGPLLTLVDEAGTVRLRLAVGAQSIEVTGTLATDVESITIDWPSRVRPIRLSLHITGTACAIDTDGDERVAFLRVPLTDSVQVTIGGAIVGDGTGFAGWLLGAKVMTHHRGAGGWRVEHDHDGDASIGGAGGGSIPRRALRDLSIGAGRYYVDGIGCHLAAPTSFARQPDLPGDPFQPGPDGTVHLLYLDVWEHLVTAIQDPALAEPALGGNGGGVRTRIVAQVRSLGLGRHPDDIDRRWAAFLRDRQPTAQLRARRHPGYEGTPIDGALYRVEVHALGNAGEVRLKWSRRNASIAYPLAAFAIATNQLRLGGVTDRHIDLSPGDWIELLDDDHLLCRQSGQLVRIADVDADTLAVLTDRIVAPLTGEHPFIRRWDGRDPGGAATAFPDAWIDLEHGVQVSMRGGVPAIGDFWVIEARDGVGVLWPQGDDGPSLCPPDGVAHHYAPLAIARTIGAGCEIDDVRQLFSAATTIEPPTPSPRPSPSPRPDKPVPSSTLPAGTLVLTDNAAPLAGCDSTGWSVDAHPVEPGWRVIASVACEDFGTVQAAASRGGIGVLTPNNGLFALDRDAAVLTPLTSPAPIGTATMTATSDHLLLMLQATASGEPERECWRMDWTGRGWRRLADLPVATIGAAFTAIGDGLRVAGGQRSWWRLHWLTRRGWRYDDEAEGWRPARTLAWPRSGAVMATTGDGLVLSGGRGYWPFARLVGRSILRATLPAGRWEAAGALDGLVGRPSIAVWNRQLFCAEGDADAADPRRAVVRPLDGRRWSVLPPLPYGYAGWALAVDNDDLLAFGLGNGDLVACVLPLRRRLQVQRWRGA